MSNSTTAWMIPATGVLPPLLILVIVRAMAPVAGIPPKSGEAMFSKYPTVALGWIMFVGMAIAKYWDEDWELYGKVDNLYEYLRDRIDFDHMDDYILDQVLLLDEKERSAK